MGSKGRGGSQCATYWSLKEEEEKEVDDQYLPAQMTSDLDFGHLTEDQQAVKAFVKHSQDSNPLPRHFVYGLFRSFIVFLVNYLSYFQHE